MLSSVAALLNRRMVGTGRREEGGCRGVRTFLPVPTAELVPDLGSPGLPQQDLDEEGVFGVGRDHDFLDVRVRGALVPGEEEKE